MALEMDYEAYRTNPSFLASAATGLMYGQIAITSFRVASFIRALGYHAIPCGNDTALSVPLAIQAGLGEMSRLGLLVTPQYGPRVRLCKVSTDLPLQADQPITFGVVEFCKTCLKCANACPAQAISREPEPSFKTVGYSNNPGVKKWYNKLEGCLKFWANKVDCGVCIASCPYNKPNNLTHPLGLRIAQTPAKGLLRQLDDVLGYGKVFDKAATANWWPVSPLDQPEAADEAGHAKPDKDLGWITIADSTTLPEVLAALSARLKSQPEKLAGVNATVQFIFTGEYSGPRYIAVRDGVAEVGEGKRPDAGCTITIKDSDFLLLASGKLSAPAGIIRGKIKFEGDMSLAPRIKQILG